MFARRSHALSAVLATIEQWDRTGIRASTTHLAIADPPPELAGEALTDVTNSLFESAGRRSTATVIA